MIYLDDMAIFAKRPFVLERVSDDLHGGMYNPDDDDDPYNYFTYTGIGGQIDPEDPGRTGTSYKFVGLDAETEYWYRVRSHYVSDFSLGEKHHAFGVAAPKLLPAANVTSNSYTANWIDAHKAQKYIVTNYSGTKITEDNSEYTFLVEGFSSCSGETVFDAMEPINNKSECYLDEYTDLKGWRGKNNFVGQNMLGGGNYTGSVLISPVIMANPHRGKLLIYVEAHGLNGDTFVITCLKSGAFGYFPFDEQEMVSGWFEVPAVEGEQIQFSSYNGLGFGLSAFEAAQSVNAGDVIRVFDSSVEVNAGEQAYTFSNLESDIYAYSVVSVFSFEGETAYSLSNNAVVIDLNNGESSFTDGIDSTNIDNIEEVSRHSIDGILVDKNYKGIVIIKNSDGSVTKRIVK